MGAQDQPLLLDPSIRDWVLVPITITMVLVGLLRHYVTQLVASSPKKGTLAAVREQRALQRGQMLRANANYLTRAAFEDRKAHLQACYASGEYLKEPPAEKDAASTPPNPMGDPAQMDVMMSGLKQQMIMMVPQVCRCSSCHALTSADDPSQSAKLARQADDYRCTGSRPSSPALSRVRHRRH